MLKVILIDDEPSAIKSLKWDIANSCPDVQVLASFTKPREALEYLEDHDPDVVFLDIEMPKMDGFQFLEKMADRAFRVVFVTAYNQYAIQAINNSAAGYLMKPIDADDLVTLVAKLRAGKLKVNNKEVVEDKTVNPRTEKRVALPIAGRLILVNIEDIIYCESNGNQCKVHLVDGSLLLVKKILKHLILMLPVSDFVRVHNSYVVNLSRIAEYIQTENYLVLYNQKKIPVARNRKPDLLAKL